jgi:AcrR family transcriptional regulator
MEEPQMATEARAPLSKERVLHAAVALAERDGIESLTMRKLAGELGVGAMSLYHYVPNKSELLDGMVTPGPASLRLHDAVLGCLRGGGFSIEMTIQAYSVQDAYIYGFALQEKNLPFDTPEQGAAVAETQVRQFAELAEQRQFATLAEEFPYLAEVVGGHVSKVGYDFAAAFVHGLDLILDALENRRETA